MPRILIYLFVAAFLATFPAHAKLSLNPFNWFSDSEVEAVPDYTQAQQDLEDSAFASLQEGREKLNRSKKRSAIRTFKKIAKLYPTTHAAAEARFLHASIRIDRGQFTRAHELLQEIVFENPAYEQFDTVIATQFQCATALMEGARGKLFFIFPGFRQYGEAIRQFEYVVANAPYGDYAPLSLMNIALIAQQEEESDLAIDALDRLINYYPQSALAPDAYYHLAKTYSELVSGREYDQGSTRQAISYYEDLLALFPNNENIGTVEANLAEMENLLASSRLELGDFFYLYRNNNTAALTFYNEAITLAPESEAAIEASDRIASIEAGVKPITSSKILRKLLMAN